MSENTELTSQEIERYARHIFLREVGGAGQKKLKNSSVLVVGAGGLGSPILSYLAAAGIGLLGIVDDDDVSLSNLQRQIIHDSENVGMAKTISAARAIGRMNPLSMVKTHTQRLDATNVRETLASYDIIVDASDNFSTRYMLADQAELLKKPLVTGALSRFDGSVTVLKPYEKDNPSYWDLFPIPPPEGVVESCAEVGVLGSVSGIIGSLQATEVIKLILNIGEPLIGKLLLYDGLHAKFDIIFYKKQSLIG